MIFDVGLYAQTNAMGEKDFPPFTLTVYNYKRMSAVEFAGSSLLFSYILLS
jgi:hypothetical protein